MVLSVFTWSRITGSIDAVERSRELRVKWERMVSLVEDAETGQRGYLLTSDVGYLGQLEAALKEIPGAFADLAQLHVGTGGPTGELTEVRALADGVRNARAEAA